MKKETILLPEEEINNIRRLATAVAEDSELVNEIACYLYDIAKMGKKELSQETITSIQLMPIEESHNIFPGLLLFLQNNMIARGSKKTGAKKVCMYRLISFIDDTREAILKYLQRPGTKLSFKEISNYSEIFNIKYIKDNISSVKNSVNISRLVIAVALSDYDKQSTFSLNPHMIQHIEFILNLVTDEQLDALIDVHKLYFN